MRRHRKAEGFNLAFLDIMACGLGAIILVFMLVKYNIDVTPQETTDLTEDIARLEQHQTMLQTALASIVDENERTRKNLSVSQTEIEELDAKEKAILAEIAVKKSHLENLKSDIENTPKAEKTDVVEDDRGGEENYVMGLKVEGRRIAILVDASASMTDEKLIDIIKRKGGDVANKKNGPKWKRLKKVVRWLLARTPSSSEVSVIAYSEDVNILGTIPWFAANNKNQISRVFDALDAVIPSGATNLQKGLEKAKALNPTDLYVITDGLPTTGTSSYKSLNPFTSCSSLLGNSSTISGECRIKLFSQSVKESAPKGVKVNVVLLPLEGDPTASNAYWAWASSTGGLLISPAKSWP